MFRHQPFRYRLIGLTLALALCVGLMWMLSHSGIPQFTGTLPR